LDSTSKLSGSGGPQQSVETPFDVPVGRWFGVVVKFAYDAGLTVQDGATLDAPATAASPIVLTALADDTAGGDTNLDGSQTLPLPGDWNGLFIPGTGQVNLNDYVELRYMRALLEGTRPGWTPLCTSSTGTC